MEQGLPGKFGKCVIDRLLGQGATAVVYHATHEGLDIQVAVKVLRRKLSELRPQYAERFLREARLAARLEHPNVVRVIDCGVQDGFHYMVMDYVDGPNCLELLQQNPGGLDWQEATRIIRQAAQGLAFAASHNIIHRDVKPSNVMLDSTGRARVSDLGLAKLTVKGIVSLTQELHTVGTPNYMSPEQIRSPADLDLRTDIYSLGASFYHLVCGAPPYRGKSSMEVVAQHLSATLTPPFKRKPGLPAPLSSMICKMMAKTPEERYRDYDELSRDLDNMLEGRSTTADGFEESKLDIPDADLRRVLDELAFGTDITVEHDFPTPSPSGSAAQASSVADGSTDLDPFGPEDFSAYRPDESHTGDSTVLAEVLAERDSWNPTIIIVLVVIGVLALIAVAVLAAMSAS